MDASASQSEVFFSVAAFSLAEAGAVVLVSEWAGSRFASAPVSLTYAQKTKQYDYLVSPFRLKTYQLQQIYPQGTVFSQGIEKKSRTTAKKLSTSTALM